MRIAALISSSSLCSRSCPSTARPTAVVSMGDSFISSEGGRWLGDGRGPVRDEVGDRPRRLRLRPARVRIRPGPRLRRERGERLPSLRRGAERIECPDRGRREGEPGLLGREGPRPLARRPKAARNISASRRRPTSSPRWRERDDVRMVVVTVGSEQRRVRRTGRRLRARLGAQSGRRTEDTCHRDAEARDTERPTRERPGP